MQECILLRQQGEVTSFTGQMHEVTLLPSNCPECTGLHRTTEALCGIPTPQQHQ